MTAISEKNGSILVIDDEESVRVSLAKILMKIGYEVQVAASGEEGLEKVRQNAFDLVITDLKMQTIDGLEVLEKVKQIQPETLVIIITGFASLDSALAAIRKGVCDYLVKPFQIETMKLVVQRSMKMKHLAEKNIILLSHLKNKNEELAKTNKELTQTQQKLLEAERLSAITETITALHHEINNPLMAMLVKVQLLQYNYQGKDKKLVSQLKLIENLTLKMALIIEKLKKITKPASKDYIAEHPMLDIEHSN